MDPTVALFRELEAAGIVPQQVRLKRFEHLIITGQRDRCIYAVDSGAMRVYYEDEAGEHDIRFAYTGSVIASLHSFIKNSPSPLSFQAIRQCSIRRYSFEKINQFLKNSTSGMNYYRQILESMILQQHDREIDLITATPEARYKRVATRSPNLFSEVPARYVASYLRTSPETYSRIKKY